MIQRILLLALMSTPNLQDTRSEYLLIKLDSQADDIKSRTTESVPVATESPEVVSTTSKFEKKTFQKLNTTNTNPAKKGTSRQIPQSCENIQPDWWCRNNYGRCNWDREVGRLCRKTCDDSYYCDCPSSKFTCNSYDSFVEEGPNNRKCIYRSWLYDGECDCNNCEDEDRVIGRRCASWEWQCNDGECIYDDYKCDREYDCSDNSDESDAACLGTYEIEQFRACSREEYSVFGYSLYDAKLACSNRDWCAMFYQRDNKFNFCSYGQTYYDQYATLYRKPRFGLRDDSESTRSQDIAIKPLPPPKIGKKSAPPLKIQLQKFVTKRFSPMG